MPKIDIRLMKPQDWSEVSELIYDSLNAWYLKNRGFKLISGAKSCTMIFPRVYEALDPNCCVLAEDLEAGRIAGSCFFHPRSTHISLGIMNVHPDYFGQKVGTLLIKYITNLADQQQLPLRLVSSSMNLESFSLYNRNGFVPKIFFQDMTVKVPENGFEEKKSPDILIRDANLNDLSDMVALEKELYSIEREKDFRFFIENKEGIWHSSVLIDPQTNQMNGFIISVNDPGSNMLGPGLSRTENQMIALILHELNHHRGRQPVWLIPTNCLKIRDAMFQIGARNCELHIAQVRGNYQPADGIVLPTFMPETS
ncbi:MAG: GNAT family N-acetyltransferase [Planctomycetia bacterium]|nr:GNAT family N-acetyltransferase [Planctomycetia bacterium]